MLKIIFNINIALYIRMLSINVYYQPLSICKTSSNDIFPHFFQRADVSGLEVAATTLLQPLIKAELFVSFTLQASEPPEAGSLFKDRWKALKLPPEALSGFFFPPLAPLLLLSSLFMGTPDPLTVCFKFDHADVPLGD